MESLRATFLPLAVAGALAGLLAWAGWQFWENQFGHETIALKIGAVFLPAGIAGNGLLAAGAGFQNSGGEGNDGVCFDKIQMAKLKLQSPSTNIQRNFNHQPPIPQSEVGFGI